MIWRARIPAPNHRGRAVFPSGTHTARSRARKCPRERRPRLHARLPGAMYAGVPRMNPASVSVCMPAFEIARAMPKSATTAWFPDRRIFSGLMSRWMMPLSGRTRARPRSRGDPQRLVDRQLALTGEPNAVIHPRRTASRSTVCPPPHRNRTAGGCADAAGLRRSRSRDGTAQRQGRPRGHPAAP